MTSIGKQGALLFWLMAAGIALAASAQVQQVLAQQVLAQQVLAQQVPAQQIPGGFDQSPRGQPQPKPTPKAQPGVPPAKAPAATAREDGGGPARGGDQALRQRVEQLEEQLSDMQVMVGTLESMGRVGGASGGDGPRMGALPPAGGGGSGGGGVDPARLDSLEVQMRAISDQLEQLTAQMRQLSGRRGDLPPVVAPEPPARHAAQPEPPRASGFGSVTVTPGGGNDPIGRLINSGPPGGSATTAAASVPAAAGPVPLPAAAAGASTSRDLYETAYGYLLQQDYGAAESAFEEFLRRHPNDRLAADAQFWLGETLYVQRRYKPAGHAFLRVIERHKTSAKVPNSILKLALSLDQLGQKDCGLFDELETRHTNAPADIKSQARALKQRVGC
jgi:tol-pal system protein YbgF